MEESSFLADVAKEAIIGDSGIVLIDGGQGFRLEGVDVETGVTVVDVVLVVLAAGEGVASLSEEFFKVSSSRSSSSVSAYFSRI